MSFSDMNIRLYHKYHPEYHLEYHVATFLHISYSKQRTTDGANISAACQHTCRRDNFRCITSDDTTARGRFSKVTFSKELTTRM